MNAFDIIKTVRVTEKGATLTEMNNQYQVVVDKHANKVDIKHAMEKLFKIHVTRVNTMHVRGKARRKRTIQRGITPSWKKAIVTLKAGEKIELT